MKRLNAAVSSIWRYRRYWRIDLIFAGILIVISVALSLHTIDLEISQRVFSSGQPDRWPAEQLPWRLLYESPPVIIGLIVPACMVVLLLSATTLCGRRYQIHSLYLLLALWIGSALIAESILKLNWGRPRPIQIGAFGGHLDFRPAFSPGVAGPGRSFPCGHSTVGFYLTAFYFLLRRRHRGWAFTVLALTLSLGLAIGIARVRVGGHFASDVAWSAAITFVVNLVLYYYVLNIPAREDTPDESVRRKRPWIRLLLLLLIPALIQLLVLIASPIYGLLDYEIPNALPAQTGIVRAGIDICPIELHFVDDGPLRVKGELFGRGLPGAAYKSTLAIHEEDGTQHVDLRSWKRGWFFGSRGPISVHVPLSHIQQLTLNAGDEIVTVVPFRHPPDDMILQIQSGQLLLPQGWQAIPVHAQQPDQGVRLVRQGIPSDSQ